MTWHRGALLSRPAWLAERVDRHADAWQLPAGADRSRAAATLWWSMSVYAMMDAPVAAVLAGAPVPDPSPDRIRIRLGPDDAVAQVDHAAAIPGAAGAAVLAAMAATITPLAALSGAGVRSLWAIASDALANRALDTAGRGAVPTAVADFAAGIAPVLPPLRFVEVAGAVFVRRNSCCLYYASPLSAGEKCASCPRRLAGERRYRIAALS